MRKIYYERRFYEAMHTAFWAGVQKKPATIECIDLFTTEDASLIKKNEMFGSTQAERIGNSRVLLKKQRGSV